MEEEEEEEVEIDNTTIDMKAEELFRTSFSFLISPYYSKITLNICWIRLGKKLCIINLLSLYLHQIDCQVFTSSTANPALKNLYQFRNFEEKKHAYNISDNYLQTLWELMDKWE